MYSRNQLKDESGVMLVEILTAITISGIMMLSLAYTYLGVTRSYHDQNIRIETQQRVNSLLDSITNELKVLGSGMPLSQNNFAMSDSGLGDASLPIFTTASATSISFRYNKNGKASVLSSNYTPSGSDLSFSVTDGSIFSVGDTIYLSDLTRAGEDGMLAEVTAIATNAITIGSSFTASTGAVFEQGSTASIVETFTYESPSDWSGITGDNGTLEMTILPMSKFTLSYYDAAGSLLSLPLSRSNIANDLAMIHLSVQVQSEKKLKQGNVYLATAEQDLNLRNLFLARQ